MVLDRAICLGSNKRPLSPEPVDTEIYPVDDDAWDDGNLSSTVQRPVMSDVRDSLPGAFARTCQSAVLIGKSLAHIREHGRTGKRSPDRDPGEVEARTMALLEKLETACAVMQDEAMSSQQQTTAESDMPGLGITSTLSPSTTTTTASSTMLSSSDDRYLAYLTPLCLARSALIATLDAYSCPESFKDSCAVSREIAEQEARLQLRSVEAIKVAATAVSDVARKLLPLLGAGGYDMSGGDSEQRRHDSLTQSMNLSRLSPLVLDAMYGAAATLHWMWKEMGDFEAGVALDLLKQCFTRISSRWRLANEYAGIIAQTELT